MTEKRVVLSFPDHSEAVQAFNFKLANERITLYVNGIPYHFNIDFLQTYLMRIRSDQRITIQMKGLPLYLRSDPIVEQILSPYCVLDYVPHDMDSMEDLTTFTCIAHTQRDILLPADIIVKMRDKAADAFIYDGQETVAFFSGYTVEVQCSFLFFEDG